MKRIYVILLLILCHAAGWAQTSKVQVAAHRGDWRNYADNALEAIESCIKMGVDMVEIDVAKTKTCCNTSKRSSGTPRPRFG